MRLSVATNFDPALVDGAKGKSVVEFYGKLRSDSVGGGRAPYQLAPIARRQLAAHVQHLKSAGMGFNYLLNASCLGNRELTRKGQREIERLLAWVCEIGATAVTVASPQLLRMVKTRFPKLSVRISLFGGVDRVRKAQMWEELGADCIVLDGMLVNRELKTLERIRTAVQCDLELLVNNNCIMGCALSPSHANAIAHTAQAWHANKGFFIDWCFLKCTQMRLLEPVEYLRSEWIRPEDLHVYEGLGYDLFKLTERDIPTPIMMRRIQAYVDRRYDGNLLDLVQPYGFRGISRDDAYYKHRRTWRWVLRFLLRPSLINPRRIGLLKKLADLRGMTEPIEGEAPVHVDNRALDGFLERFQKAGCRDVDCNDCRWCHTWAEKAVRIDEPRRRVALQLYDELFAALDGGAMWRYGKGARSCAGCAVAD